MVFEPVRLGGGGGLGVPPAPTLLEAGMVAVGHYCMREGVAAPRWFASLAEAAAVYVGLGSGAAVRSQWEMTMKALRASDAPCRPERPRGLRAGYGSEHETREAARRVRELAKLAGEQQRLRAQLEQQRDAERTAWETGGADDGPSGEVWTARIRKAAGYEGAPASEVVGERDLGLADGVETSSGPRVIFDMQRDIASFGGEKGWMQRDDVDEDGWQEGWRRRAEAACEGLMVDEAGYVAWRTSGARLSAEEAAERGPAVEMATRARLALGEDVEVECGEPTKRRGGRGDGEGKEEGKEGGGGGAFVNVQAARVSILTMAEWCAKIGAQAVFTLDGTRTTVGGRDGAGRGGVGGGGSGRGGAGGGGSGGGGGGGEGWGGYGCGVEDRVCPMCRMEDGSQTWGRCAGCEREVHTRCCSEEAHGFCLECAGATDEELFDWVNDLKLQVQAARREEEEAREREAAVGQAGQGEDSGGGGGGGGVGGGGDGGGDGDGVGGAGGGEGDDEGGGGGGAGGSGGDGGDGGRGGGGGGDSRAEEVGANERAGAGAGATAAPRWHGPGGVVLGLRITAAPRWRGPGAVQRGAEGGEVTGGPRRGVAAGNRYGGGGGGDEDGTRKRGGYDGKDREDGGGGGGNGHGEHLRKRACGDGGGAKRLDEEGGEDSGDGGRGGGGGGGDERGGGGGGSCGGGYEEGGGSLSGDGDKEGRGFGSGGTEAAEGGDEAEAAGGARTVAAWAAVRHDGARESGALPEGVRDNYMAEMAAQLAVAAKADVKRVVIVFDATSPPEVLRRFVWSCRRKRQRIFRRDWLDTWWRQLQKFEVVVFLWQTSHVGAPVNEWADRAAAEAALAGRVERMPELLAVEYASLEIEQADGQLIRGGPRATASAAAQREVERRLAVGCGSVQMVEACDLELPRLPERLVTVAETVLCGRAQIGDARRFCGRLARRMAAALGCPFGCGCGFAWHDVAFTCKGEELVRLRAVWMVAAEAAMRVLAARKPHSQWRRMLKRGGEEGGKALRHGAADEVEMRRLVGGAVLRTGEGEVDGCSAVRAAVGRAVRAGLELQAAGRAATASFEWQVRKEVRRHAVARRFAARWREATRHGGPRRVAALREAATVRDEAEAALVRLEEEGWAKTGLQCETGGLQTLGQWAKLGEMWKEIWTRARSTRSISPACALREWRWLSGLRLWRWHVSRGGSRNRGVGSQMGHRRIPLPQDWERVMQAVLGCWGARVTFGLEMIMMDGRELDDRAYEARRRWVDGGGRRRLEWLRRWEVDEGREADKKGRWRVARVMDVRRPEGRHGRQLEVQVEWAGVDTLSGAAWSVEWVTIAWCTGDVRKEARRLEERRYPAARAAAGPGGSRKSPRLMEGGGGGSGERDEGGGTDSDSDVGGEAGGGNSGGVGDAGGGGGDRAGGGGDGGGGGRARRKGGAAADPIGAARASARAVARLNPTGRHRRRRPSGVDGEDTAGAEAADEEGGEDADQAEADDLEVLLHEVGGRGARREEMERRKEEEADALMDNGVRIHPYFRGGARPGGAEEAEAAAGGGVGPRCQAGHCMHRRGTGAAGLTCDGGCGRALRRGTGWWCCDECDFDVCDACGGGEEGEEGEE